MQSQSDLAELSREEIEAELLRVLEEQGLTRQEIAEMNSEMLRCIKECACGHCAGTRFYAQMPPEFMEAFFGSVHGQAAVEETISWINSTAEDGKAKRSQ